jgi:hypothetical protein
MMPMRNNALGLIRYVGKQVRGERPQR